MPDHIAQLAGLEAGVDRYRDRTEPHRPELQREGIQRGLQQQPDAVALADARAVEAAGHGDRRVGELAVARTLAGEDDGVSRRVRAQIDEPGECRRQRLPWLAFACHDARSISRSSTER